MAPAVAAIGTDHDRHIMTAGAMSNLMMSSRGWLRTGPAPVWPSAAPKASITAPSAPAPPLQDQQNSQMMAASTRRTQFTAVPSTRPATKSP